MICAGPGAVIGLRSQQDLHGASFSRRVTTTYDVVIRSSRLLSSKPMLGRSRPQAQ
jgi:hypothetical protein